LETLGKSDADDPAWALQQSKVTNLKAGIIWRGGKAEEARRLFEKDLAAVEVQLQSNPEEVKLLLRRARLEANLGGHYVESLNRELALPHLKKAQDLFTSLVEKDGKSQDARAGLAGTLHNLAILSYRDNQAKVALADFHAATELCGQLAKEFPTSGTHQGKFAFAKQHEAMCLRALGRKEEAAKLDVEALRIREGLARSNPAVVGVQIAWAASCRDVADDYRSEGRHTEALALYRQAVGVIEPLAKKDDAAVVVRQLLVRLLDSMGRELHYVKHTPEALAAFTRAIDHGELLVAQLPNQFDCRSTLGIAYWDLAQVHANENALGAARTAMQKNIDHERKLIEQAPSLVYYRKSLSRSLVTLANWDRKEKKFADAVQHARERAQLWPGNADELFHVAQDFCHTAVQAEVAKSPEADRAWAQCEATLRQALTAGLAWAKLDSVPILQAFSRRPAYAELRKEFGPATAK
jgi:tetratricopeptide (TPR) repeat protein